MKKLLLVNTRLETTGGIETYSKDVARAFMSAGWSVTALNFRDSYCGEKEGFNWQGLMPKGWLRYRLAVRVRHFLARRWLRRHLAAYDFVVCSHELVAPVVRVEAERQGKPYCVVLHGLEVWQTLPKREIAALRAAAALVHVSAFTKEEVLRRFPLAGAPFIKISPCVDLEMFDAVAPGVMTENHDQPFQLLTVGRLDGLERDKGHRLVMKALHILKERGLSVVYKIVGDGSDRSALEEFAREQRVEDWVEFAGRVSHEAKLQAYWQCDLFLLVAPLQRLSRGRLSGEGFGIVYLEAGACGKPVIGGDEGGSIDPVREGENGYRSGQNPEQLANRIESLMVDSEQCAALGQCSRQLVEREYSFEVFTALWIELAASLTGKQKGMRK